MSNVDTVEEMLDKDNVVSLFKNEGEKLKSL